MQRAVWIVLTLVLAVVVASCGGSGGGDGERRGSISFLVFGEPEELKAFRNVIRAFRDVEPDIRVNLIEASDREDLIQRLATSFGGGQPPDLFLINYRFFPQFAVKNVLEPIGPRLDDSDAFQEDDFFEEAIEAFRHDGELTCLPQNISSLVVYYNRDLFRKYGVAEPARGWTWKDMTTKAVALTKDTDADGKIDQYGLGVEPTIIRVAPFVWSNGGEVVKEDLSGFALDSPEAKEVLDEFFQLRNAYRVIPSEEEVEAEDDEARFMNGRTAMVLSSRRSTPTFRTITKFDWDVAPLPRFKEPATILHSDAYCMTKASKSKEAAWAFMEYALGPDGQKIVAASGRTVPSLKEVANSPAFLDPNAKPRSSKVFLDSIPTIRRVPSLSTWPEIEDAAEGVFEEALYEGATASEIVREVDAATKGIFVRAER